MKRYGQDAANEINTEALKFVARRVAKWYTSTHGVEFAALAMTEFVKYFSHIPATMWDADMVDVEQIALGEDEWETVVSKSFSLRMLAAAGAIEGYDCPCLEMRAGWFSGMGVAVQDSCVECARTGGDICRFRAKRQGGSS